MTTLTSCENTLWVDCPCECMVLGIHAFKHTCALQHLELGRKAFTKEK